MYDLYAICYHHGDDLETGHYTAACKNPYDGHWYKFDDSRVTPVDDENAYSELVNNTAYMLFYRRRRPHVTHSCSSDEHSGHWALRMPKYVKRTTDTLNELIEVKEEHIEEAKDQQTIKEHDSESDVTAPTHSPSLSRSVASLPDDNADATSPHKLNTALIHNATIIQSPTLQRPLIVEVNGSGREEPGASDKEPGVYIHKDVHVNPKMTPVDTRRPRSVELPARTHTLPPLAPAAPNAPTAPTVADDKRKYPGAPLVATVNGLEYRPTTEDLVLSMFHDSKFIVPRHAPHIAGESHRTGENSSVWTTRIST